MTYAFHWRKAIIVSVCLHIFLLAVAGYLMVEVISPITISEQIFLDVEIVSNPMDKTANASGLSETVASSAATSTGKIHSVTSSQMADVHPNTTTPFMPSQAIRQYSTVHVAESTSAVVAKMSEGTTGGQTGEAGQHMNGSNAAGGGTSGSGTVGSGLTGGNFVSNGDGTYTALSPSGIDYTIVYSVEANYPDEARAVGYTRPIRVEAEILVGLNGSVESVSILNNVPDLGFREATRQALLQWKFSPIYHQGINIKMKFYKKIYFEPS